MMTAKEKTAYRSGWQRAHKDKMAAAQFRFRVKMKTEVLSHYGPSGQLCCSWENCHVSDPDMLELDHVNNDANHRSNNDQRGITLYVNLKKSGYPTGFQTLCCNHNRKKELLRKRRGK